MKTPLVILLVIVSSLSVYGQRDSIRYLLNEELISAERLGLLNPNNITKIDVLNSVKPPEIRIVTTPIHFISYTDLKKRLKIPDSLNPTVTVDDKTYLNKDDFLIDRSLIKKIDFLPDENRQGGAMRIKSKFYKKRKAEENIPTIKIR